jgi:N4-gp56 family major capsid protein
VAEYYDINDPSTNKLWSKQVWRVFRKADSIWDPKYEFVGPDPENNPIVEVDDFEKSTGDEITIPLLFQFGGDGVVGDQVLEGNEEALDSQTFKFKIDDQVQGWRSRGIMSQQRVRFNIVDESMRFLKDWWKSRRAVAACNHLASNTRQTNMAFTANNTVVAADNQHIFRLGTAGGGVLGAGDDATVGSDLTAKFDITVIPKLITFAESLQVPIRPWIYKGNPYYGIWLHPFVIEDMFATNTALYDILTKALQGGGRDGNPLFTRALGMYRNTLLFSEPHLPQGTSNAGAAVANTRRCVFFGAGSLALAYGRRERGNFEKMRWHSGVWDHGRKFFGSAGMVWGMKSPNFSVNGTTRLYGRIVVTCYTQDRLPYTWGSSVNPQTTYDLEQHY